MDLSCLGRFHFSNLESPKSDRFLTENVRCGSDLKHCLVLAADLIDEKIQTQCDYMTSSILFRLSKLHLLIN